jgi:hypothetical protein
MDRKTLLLAISLIAFSTLAAAQTPAAKAPAKAQATPAANAPICNGGNCLMFITSVTNLNGNLGGLTGADATCQARADAASRPGKYKAWLSDTTQGPATRFTQSPRPYVRVDGVVVANNWTELISGALQEVLLDEKGAASVGTVALTNTGADGAPGGAGGSNKNCMDWTSNKPGPLANNGNPGSFKDRRWTFNSAGACEDSVGSLICVQQ